MSTAQRITDLREQVRRLEREVADEKKKCQDAEINLKKANGAKRKAEQASNAANGLANQCKKSIDDKEKTIAQLKGTNKTLNDRFKKLEEKLKKTNKEWIIKQAMLNEAFAKTDGDKTTAETQVEGLTNALHDATRERDAALSRAKTLQQRCNEFENLLGKNGITVPPATTATNGSRGTLVAASPACPAQG